jgi:hypothetical protein
MMDGVRHVLADADGRALMLHAHRQGEGDAPLTTASTPRMLVVSTIAATPARC